MLTVGPCLSAGASAAPAPVSSWAASDQGRLLVRYCPCCQRTLPASELTALSCLRAAALQIQVKELKMQLKAAGGAPEATLLQMDGSDAPMSAKEREELAVALTAGEGDRRTVDAQVGFHVCMMGTRPASQSDSPVALPLAPFSGAPPRLAVCRMDAAT